MSTILNFARQIRQIQPPTVVEAEPAPARVTREELVQLFSTELMPSPLR
jgi:hypothetical protein